MAFYEKPKKMDKILRVFVTLCILLLFGVIAFGIFISRDGGAGFRNLIEGGSSETPSFDLRP